MYVGLRNISKISELSDSFKRLDISKNDIVDIRPITTLTTLESVDLSQNNISSLPASFNDLKEIQFLDLSGNNITSISALEALSSLEKLAAINLSGNPICNTIGFYA